VITRFDIPCSTLRPVFEASASHDAPGAAQSLRDTNEVAIPHTHRPALVLCDSDDEVANQTAAAAFSGAQPFQTGTSIACGGAFWALLYGYGL
jgi:hypothetical protein